MILIVFFTSDLIVLFHFGLFPLGLFEQLFVGVRLLEFLLGFCASFFVYAVATGKISF